MLDRVELGLHLTLPWRIVLAGAPNAGKSSLANAILGYERAIVWPEPGTTRDVLTATTAIDGWPVELADTAGLRPSTDAIEAEGVSRAQGQIAIADLVIFVADATTAWDAAAFEHMGKSPRRILIAHNKCDLARPPADGRPPGLKISAKTGLGIDLLLSAVSRALVAHPPPAGAAVPFSGKQFTAIEAIATALDRGDVSFARRLIESLLAVNHRSR